MTLQTSSQPKPLVLILWLQGSGLACLLALAWWLPTSWLPACLFRQWTGWPCPLCGLTRSALALGRLEIVEAFKFYPFPTLLWFSFLALNLTLVVSILQGKDFRLPTRVAKRRLFRLVLLVACAGWGYSLVAGVGPY